MDASPQAGGSPNGTSNDSTSGSTSKPNPSSTDKQDTSAKKRPARGKEVVVIERADKVLASAATYEKDPDVARLLGHVRADRADLVSAAAAPVVDRQSVAAQKKSVTAARKTTLSIFGDFKKCVGVTAAGKDFLARTRAKGRIATVRAVIEEISPEILAHNAPLLKKVTEQLEEFDRQNSGLQSVSVGAGQSIGELRFAIKRLSLSVNALAGAVRTLESTAAREALIASRKAKPAKRAA